MKVWLRKHIDVIRRTLIMGLLEFIASFVAGISILVFTEHRYLPTFITDIILGFLGFTLIKRINAADTWAEQLTYVFAGAIAYQLAMRLF